jgi:acetyltransferase-like isoleucine patch superfamily enzyme
MGPHATVGQRGDVRPVSVLGAGAVVASGTVVDGERIAG